MQKTYYCRHCAESLTIDPAIVSPGYFATCTDCDEDFYQCEVLDNPPMQKHFRSNAGFLPIWKDPLFTGE